MAARKKSTSKRTLVAPRGNKRYVRRNKKGKFNKVVSVSRSLSKDRPPVVMIGNHIKPGDRLGVVECMKIPTDVVSYAAGEILQIMVEDGQTVEYGQPLFTVSPIATENGAE